MEDKGVPVLIFDDSSKDKVLKSLGFDSEDSCLVDEDGLIQTDSQFEKISAEDFGGVLQGSKIVIRKDFSEIVRYFASRRD